MAAYAALPLETDVVRSDPVLCDLLCVKACIFCRRSCNLWTVFITCSSGACSVDLGSGDDKSCQPW